MEKDKKKLSTLSRRSRRKGAGYEKKIEDVLHDFLMSKSSRYREVFSETDGVVRVKRDATSFGDLTGVGDINIPLVKTFPISPECKHEKTLNMSIDSLFRKKSTVLFDYWRKHRDKLIKAGRESLYPVLFFRANNTLDYVLFCKQHFYWWFSVPPGMSCMRVCDGSMDFFIFTLIDFLKVIVGDGNTDLSDMRKRD